MNITIRREPWPSNSPTSSEGYGLYANDNLLQWSAWRPSQDEIDRRVGQYLREGK